jgi:predicted GH43/DUF377 family glycosyl hydrolase
MQTASVAAPGIQRFAQNPILVPDQVRPSRPDMVVECLLNPGVFRYQGRIGLLLRVAERPVQEKDWVSTPLIDPFAEGGVRILRIRRNDPDLRMPDADARGFDYKGRGYLTTLSHLRLAWSDDGIHFTPDDSPTLMGEGSHEAFGIEDCRVEWVGDRYWLTYTAVSEFGVGCGLIATRDWKSFDRHGIILPPHNKDVGLFPEKVGGRRWMIHRPSGLGPGGNFIWVAESPDMLHWGGHTCIATTRPGGWDGERIGGGAAPIKTERGWLSIYHGADAKGRYCLGALLLDLEDPRRVLARSLDPLMTPTELYERNGFFGNVVFTNGHLVDGDRLTLYYGAADSVICGAELSISEILATL